jgi:phosphoglycolate phosphatase
VTLRAAIFDLDGTLLDTLADLGESMNEALGELGLPEHPLSAYRRFVGDGVTKLARRALPPERRDDETIARCIAGMRRIYGGRWDRKTVPYPGIPTLLERLAERGIALAVLSNKPDDMCRTVIARYFPATEFRAVVGARANVAHKPDPVSALEIARGLALAPREILYVGDTDTDMRTAVAAGMLPVGALWGFRDADELRASGASRLAKTPLDVIDLLSDDLSSEGAAG